MPKLNALNASVKLSLFLILGACTNAEPESEPNEIEQVQDSTDELDRLQEDYDNALGDLNSPIPPPAYRTDPAIVSGACGNADLMELACKEYGTTCDVAKIARKQCEQFKAGS